LSSEMIMLLNLALMGLAIYGAIRLSQRRRQNQRPKRKSEIDIVDDKFSALSQELKELAERLQRERAERMQ